MKERDERKCDQCDGIGCLFTRTMQPIKCPLCEGTGKLLDFNSLWQIQGQLIKKYRLDHALTLREFCRQNKIDPSNMLKMENGILKPNPKIVKFILSKQ